MRFVELELSICVDDVMSTEEINEMIKHSLDLILNQDGVSGVASSDWVQRIVKNSERPF